MNKQIIRILILKVLVCTYSIKICSQNIIENIEFLKACNTYSLDTSFYQERSIRLLSREIDSLTFHTDKNLVHYLQDNLDTLRRNQVQFVMVIHGHNGTDELISIIQNYIHSEPYPITDTLKLMQQLADENKSSLFNWLIRKSSSTLICRFIETIDTHLNEDLLFSIINQKTYHSYNEEILLKVLTTYKRIYPNVYRGIIQEFDFHHNKTVDSIMQHEKEWFLTQFDSSKFIDVYTLNIFNGVSNKTPLELKQENEFQRYSDSLYVLQELHRKREAEISDSIWQSGIWDRMSTEEKQEYNASIDTTLYNGEARGIASGDDGTLFYLWSTDSLLLYLKQVQNIDVLYHENGANDFGLNTNPKVIHLRKIIQIIGDRIYFGKIQLNKKQQSILGRYIDYYFSHAKSPDDSLESESKFQLLRLWKYILPDFYRLCESDSLQIKFLARYFLDFMFDEEIVNYFIKKIKSPGDLHSKVNYFEFLSYLYFTKEIYALDLPPRRHIRNSSETQDWIDRIIQPVFTQYGYKYEPHHTGFDFIR